MVCGDGRRGRRGDFSSREMIGDRAGNEFRSSITDFRILAALARYYSSRLQAAVS